MVCPQRLKIALPVDFAAQLSNLTLLSQAQQSSEPELHRFTFGLKTRCPKNVPHQFVVNHNIHSHVYTGLVIL
jgi:hypothetical protein